MCTKAGRCDRPVPETCFTNTPVVPPTGNFCQKHKYAILYNVLLDVMLDKCKAILYSSSFQICLIWNAEWKWDAAPKTLRIGRSVKLERFVAPVAPKKRFGEPRFVAKGLIFALRNVLKMSTKYLKNVT